MCEFRIIVLLTDNAYACDPRVIRYREEEKEKKEAQKRAKKEAARQKAQEEERVSLWGGGDRGREKVSLWRGPGPREREGRGSVFQGGRGVGGEDQSVKEGGGDLCHSTLGKWYCNIK